LVYADIAASLYPGVLDAKFPSSATLDVPKLNRFCQRLKRSNAKAVVGAVAANDRFVRSAVIGAERSEGPLSAHSGQGVIGPQCLGRTLGVNRRSRPFGGPGATATFSYSAASVRNAAKVRAPNRVASAKCLMKCTCWGNVGLLTQS